MLDWLKELISGELPDVGGDEEEAGNKKYAIRVLRRLPDGTVGTFYIDSESGEQLDSLEGYDLVSAGNLEGGNEADESTPGFNLGGGGGTGGGFSQTYGGGGSNFLQNPVAWEDSLIPQLARKISGKEKAPSIEEKVQKAGGTIAPARASTGTGNGPIQSQTPPAPGPDLSVLSSLPPELTASNVNPTMRENLSYVYDQNQQKQQERKQQSVEGVSPLEEKQTPDTTARNITSSLTDPDYLDNTDDLTVAGTAASYGLSRQPSQAEVSDLAYTIAGEMTPSDMDRLIQGDPTAQAELASIISSYENRVQSGSKDVLRGSQYNSNLKENEKVTSGNYGLYGEALKSSINDFYKGGMAGEGMTEATHYYNPSTSSPSWTNAYPEGEYYNQHYFQDASGYGEYRTDLSDHPAVREAGANRVNYQVDNAPNRLDNSDILSSAPDIGGSGLGGFGDSSGDSYHGGGQFDYSGSSGSGYSNSGNSYSPASGDYSPGGGFSNEIYSSPPSIDTSGYSGDTYSSQEIADNNSGLSGWDGW